MVVVGCCRWDAQVVTVWWARRRWYSRLLKAAAPRRLRRRMAGAGAARMRLEVGGLALGEVMTATVAATPRLCSQPVQYST